MEIIIIERAIIISFIVIALWCFCLEGMIFGKIRVIDMPEWLASPLFECPVCMQIWHGTYLYLFLFHESVKDWAVIIMVATGIATIFVKIKRN